MRLCERILLVPVCPGWEAQRLELSRVFTMDWFLITPFSINVLNVLILILFMVYFLFRAKRKSKATLFLIAFLMGVALVFLSFAFIFSSLNPSYSTLGWLILHAVVFTSIAMV